MQSTTVADDRGHGGAWHARSRLLLKPGAGWGVQFATQFATQFDAQFATQFATLLGPACPPTQTFWERGPSGTLPKNPFPSISQNFFEKNSA